MSSLRVATFAGQSMDDVPVGVHAHHGIGVEHSQSLPEHVQQHLDDEFGNAL